MINNDAIRADELAYELRLAKKEIQKLTDALGEYKEYPPRADYWKHRVLVAEKMLRTLAGMTEEFCGMDFINKAAPSLANLCISKAKEAKELAAQVTTPPTANTTVASGYATSIGVQKWPEAPKEKP